MRDDGVVAVGEGLIGEVEQVVEVAGVMAAGSR